MQPFKKLSVTLTPLFIAVVTLLVLLALPSLVIAADGEGDLQLSSTGASLPEIAANNTFVAVVYARNGRVFLRANNYQDTKGWWATSLDVGSGAAPRLAFKPGENVVHIVWADAAGTAIYHRLFTLSESSAAGGAQHTITTGSGLATPDIAVDSSANKRVHVAWATSTQVQTSLSTDNGANWSTPVTLGTNASQPALAVSNSFVHLVFVGSSGTTLEYFRSGLGSHSWGSTTSQVLQGSYADIRNPAIAATSGGDIFLAWDSVKNAVNNIYGLVGTSSNSDGNTGSWASVQHITSTVNYNASTGGTSDERLSKTRSTSPQFEAGLRPGLAVTGADFAVVWHERPDINCQSDIGGGPPLENGTAEIFRAAHSGNSWSETEVLGNDLYTYAIDPEIAVDSSNVNHIVFLKATNINCSAGGGSGGYAVYYRGPLQTIQPIGVYLPIIRKGS